MCHIITCGFPFASEMALAFPNVLGGTNIRYAPDVKVTDFRRHIEGSKMVTGPIIKAWGYQAVGDWWAYYNHTTACVKKITGCDLGDIPCAERHAFQRLIRGPFKSSLTETEENRISGVPKHIKHAILTLPHSYAPRLDAAIHIRAQFRGFENMVSVNDPHYQKEVSDFLNSTEAQAVFSNLERKLIEVLSSSRQDLNMSKEDISYVYLASDNENIKDNFTAKLEQDSNYDFPIKVMRVETKFVQHVKNLNKFRKDTNNEGLLDLVFDWYCLTLANVILAWRKGGTSTISTFVHSAQRVSGTTERTMPYGPVGHGVGTKGIQLIKDRRGNLRFDLMWFYTFLEDYQI
jgi:hypothetical protein